MARSAPKVILNPKIVSILEQITRRHHSSQIMVRRSLIILKAAQGQQNKQIAAHLNLKRHTVGLWRTRFSKEIHRLDAAIATECKNSKLEEIVHEILSDKPRPGTPPNFTPEQVTQIIALACTPPCDCAVELSHWTPTTLAKEIIKRNIADSISPTSVWRFLKSGRLKTPS